jgi:3'-5' exonuclease
VYDAAVERTFLVLDIETVPDGDLYRPPEKPSGTEKPFPPVYAHRIVVMGVLWLDAGHRMTRLGVLGEGKDEAGVLWAFSDFMRKNEPDIVTFNGRSFDMPVILQRSLRHGVPMAWFYGRGDYRYRYSVAGHLDLCDLLAEHGAARYVSLDAAARLVGLPGKVGVDGSQVEGLWHAGQIETLKNYCLCDVAQTAFLFLRFRLLQGALDTEGYRRAAEDLHNKLSTDARVSPLFESADLDRLLLR